MISTGPPRRTELTFEVPGEVNLDRLEATTLEAIDGLSHVSDEPPPRVLGRGLAQGALVVSVLFWHESRIGNEVAATDQVVRALGRAYSAAEISTGTESLRVSLGETTNQKAGAHG